MLPLPLSHLLHPSLLELGRLPARANLVPYPDEAALQSSWHDLGTFLHERCAGADAWVLSGNKAVTRHLRLRATKRMPVRNGPIDCRWLHYELRPRDE